MEQLASISALPPVNYNNPTVGKIVISKQQTIAEVRTRKWMDQKSFEQLINPEAHKTKGMGNSPRSTWDKLQTEHKVSEEKYTCSNIAEYEKKNTRYQFNTGNKMPVKRVSAMIGVSHSKSAAKERTYWTSYDKNVVDLKEPKANEVDDRIKHELK